MQQKKIKQWFCHFKHDSHSNSPTYFCNKFGSNMEQIFIFHLKHFTNVSTQRRGRRTNWTKLLLGTLSIALAVKRKKKIFAHKIDVNLDESTVLHPIGSNCIGQDYSTLWARQDPTDMNFPRELESLTALISRKPAK